MFIQKQNGSNDIYTIITPKNLYMSIPRQILYMFIPNKKRYMLYIYYSWYQKNSRAHIEGRDRFSRKESRRKPKFS